MKGPSMRVVSLTAKDSPELTQKGAGHRSPQSCSRQRHSQDYPNLGRTHVENSDRPQAKIRPTAINHTTSAQRIPCPESLSLAALASRT
jgi:hypothetical protein